MTSLPRIRPATLAACIALGLSIAGAVVAQSATPTPAQQRELDAARADLDRAAKRFAELNRSYGGEDGTHVSRREMVRRPVIGVLLGADPQAGVRIAGVTPGGAARDAGLRTGDRLLAIDGKPVAGADADARVESARALLAGARDGTPVRLRYARDGKDATVAVTPKVDERVFVWNSEDRSLSKLGGRSLIVRGPDGRLDIEADSIERELPPGIAPDVRREVIRIAPGGDCRGDDCRLPMLAEAFRWNGLNLASVDPQLGRYFGTQRGVLVLSAGPELAGLQAGDVIRQVDGKDVATPREAMNALRAKPADSRVRIDYWRDRKAGTVQVKVPEALPLRVPLPPMPPAPPAPPVAPGAPEAPVVSEQRKVVIVDRDGKTHTWEDDGGAPLPPGAQRIEKRRMVFVDADGTTHVWEGDDAPPPPAPPTPPAPPATPSGAATPPSPPPPPAAPTPPIPAIGDNN